MPDFKSMYYYLAGMTATAVDVLEATTTMLTANAESLANLKEKLKMAQQITEEMFISSDDDEDALNGGPEETT